MDGEIWTCHSTGSSAPGHTSLDPPDGNRVCSACALRILGSQSAPLLDLSPHFIFLYFVFFVVVFLLLAVMAVVVVVVCQRRD